MRILNKKQKKLLDNWLKKENERKTFPQACNLMDYLPEELWFVLLKTNDFENLYQAVNVYINEKQLEYIYS